MNHKIFIAEKHVDENGGGSIAGASLASREALREAPTPPKPFGSRAGERRGGGEGDVIPFRRLGIGQVTGYQSCSLWWSIEGK